MKHAFVENHPNLVYRFRGQVAGLKRVHYRTIFYIVIRFYNLGEELSEKELEGLGIFKDEP